MNETTWYRAFPLSELRVGEGRVVREGSHHVAVFRVDDDELYAVDNRCPHEGYPLAKGYVSDCVVTCPWHNFKFDLRDGRCVMGDEAVRTFPLRLSNDHVEIDLTPPDPEVERARLIASLEQGLLERKLGQVARELVRLIQLGVGPDELALQAARFDAARAPWGATHVLPMAEDVAAIAERFEGVEAVLPLMQAFDQASDSHVRRAPRKAADPVDPGDDPEVAGARLRELTEAERVTEAEALLRGALAKGWGRAVVEPWLFQLTADHFLDFGHALIYQVKVFDLLERVGWEHAPSLLPAHLVGLVNGTREDTLPEWLWFRDGTASLLAEADGVYAGLGRRRLDVRAFVEILVDGARDDMLARLETELHEGVVLRDVVDAISIAASERLQRFDPAIDADPTIQESWLGVTHTLTYANALRSAIERFDDPAVIRLVAYGARFVNNAAVVDAPVDARVGVEPRSASATEEDVIAAIAARDPQRASSTTARYLVDGGDVVTLRDAFEDLALDDAGTRPIVGTHLIKTTRAAADEQRRIEHAELRHRPMIAVARWLASPVRERPVGRLAHEAIRFVVHGKVPKTLT
ncbi:MAG: nitrite reductase (NAD(P)H) small subunit [Polyangiaceae bacterium]